MIKAQVPRVTEAWLVQTDSHIKVCQQHFQLLQKQQCFGGAQLGTPIRHSPCGVLLYPGVGVIVKELRRVWGAVKRKDRRGLYPRSRQRLPVRRLVKQGICHAKQTTGIVTQEVKIVAESHVNTPARNAPPVRMHSEYSLIVLWPHTDERDRTAERERETKVTEQTFRASSDISGRSRILNHLPFTCGYLMIFTTREIQSSFHGCYDNTYFKTVVTF